MRIDANRPIHSETARCTTAVFSLLICLPFGALAGSPLQGTVSELPNLLEQQGWRYQSDAEGNVYYQPARPLTAADQGKKPPFQMSLRWTYVDSYLNAVGCWKPIRRATCYCGQSGHPHPPISTRCCVNVVGAS